MCPSSNTFCFLPGVNARLASMKSTPRRSAFAPPTSRERSKTMIATGMPVVVNSLGGSPITASSRFSSTSALADATLAVAPEEHAVRDDHRDAAPSSASPSRSCG